MKNIIPIILVVLIISCSTTEKPNINFTNFKDIKNVEISMSKDTMHILLHDNSYIYFRDYDSLKINYLLWKNKHVLNDMDFVKITINHQDDGYINRFSYNKYEQNDILKAYQINLKYDSVSDYFLKEFNPTEVLNFRNANEFLNKEFENYSITYIELLNELTTCKENCDANNRLKMIIKVITVTGINDFWTHELIDASELTEKLKSIQKLCDIND